MVARKQSIRSVGGHVRNLITSYFERKETKFVGNKTAINRPNRPSLCLLFVKLALLCVFSSFIRPITYARANREHVFDAGGSTKPETAMRKCERSTKEPITTNPSIAKDSWASCGYATLNSCRSMSSYGRVLAASWRVFAASSRMLAARSEPVYFFFVQTFVDFALSLPGHSLWVCLQPTPRIFSQKRQNGQEVKISSKFPTSPIASPHVKYVKGCQSNWTCCIKRTSTSTNISPVV